MADTIKIGKISDALDSCLSKIDKLNLSRDSLLRHQELIESLVSSLERIEEKERAIRSSGLSTGERSSMLRMTEELRSSLVSGSDVDSILRREARQMDLARRGSELSSLPRFGGSDRIMMRESASRIGSSGLAGSLPSSSAQLSSLLSWARAGGDSSSGVMSMIQNRALSLGSSLSSSLFGSDGLNRGSDWLVESAEESERDAQFEDAVGVIKHTSDEILDALHDRGAVASTVRRQERKIDSSPARKESSGSWMSALRLVGAVGGTVAALGGLFLIPSVQDFLARLVNPEKRREMWDDLMQSVIPTWETIKDTVSDVWDKANEIYSAVLSMGTSVSDSTVAMAKAGDVIYDSATPEAQGMYRSVMQSMRGAEAISVDGVSSVDSLMSQAAGSLVSTGVGLAASGVALKLGKNVFKMFRGIYGGAKALGLVGGLSALSSSAVTGCLGLLVGGAVTMGAIMKLNAEQRKWFNMMSIRAAIEEGSSVAVVLRDGVAEPEVIPLALMSGEDGSTLFSQMSEEDQLGYAAKYSTDIAAYTHNANNVSLLRTALSRGVFKGSARRAEVESLLSEGDPGKIDAFVSEHRNSLLGSVRDSVTPVIASPDSGFFAMPVYGDGEHNGGVLVFPDAGSARGFLGSNSGYFIKGNANHLAQKTETAGFGEDATVYSIPAVSGAYRQRVEATRGQLYFGSLSPEEQAGLRASAGASWGNPMAAGGISLPGVSADALVADIAKRRRGGSVDLDALAQQVSTVLSSLPESVADVLQRRGLVGSSVNYVTQNNSRLDVVSNEQGSGLQ